MDWRNAARGRAGRGGSPGRWVAAVFALASVSPSRPIPSVRLSLSPAELVADGYDAATVTISGPSSLAPQISARGARVEDLAWSDGRWTAQIRAGILPGSIPVRVRFPGKKTASAEIRARLSASDTFEDGTPDFLRLNEESDRQAFRRWFTWLAEAQYFQEPSRRPVEISDCAALIRYAYREALHAHDAAWAEAARVPVVPAFDSVAKYQYPYTPLGAALFRVKEGPFEAREGRLQEDFAQFADAQTLRKFNTHFVSRDLDRAIPGDLLFFRQEEGTLPFHSMIYLGESQVRRDGGPYLLYHTGPGGEIKRLSVAELENFPQPEWRPTRGNPSFLGVFRWNILR